MLARFYSWILRREIRRYMANYEFADLMVVIEQERHCLFYEDNRFDAALYYRDAINSAYDYVHHIDGNLL